MAKIYKSVEELIGNTPLLELTKIEKETGATLLAKVEALNPGGSAKDRIAKQHGGGCGKGRHPEGGRNHH